MTSEAVFKFPPKTNEIFFLLTFFSLKFRKIDRELVFRIRFVFRVMKITMFIRKHLAGQKLHNKYVQIGYNIFPDLDAETNLYTFIM